MNSIDKYLDLVDRLECLKARHDELKDDIEAQGIKEADALDDFTKTELIALDEMIAATKADILEASKKWSDKGYEAETKKKWLVDHIAEKLGGVFDSIKEKAAKAKASKK